MKKKFAGSENVTTFAAVNPKRLIQALRKDTVATGFESRPHRKREHSSVGLEHLPYKQRVGGSTPSAPTKKEIRFTDLFLFFAAYIVREQLDH